MQLKLYLDLGQGYEKDGANTLKSIINRVDNLIQYKQVNRIIIVERFNNADNIVCFGDKYKDFQDYYKFKSNLENSKSYVKIK